MLRLIAKISNFKSSVAIYCVGDKWELKHEISRLILIKAAIEKILPKLQCQFPEFTYQYWSKTLCWNKISPNFPHFSYLVVPLLSYVTMTLWIKVWKDSLIRTTVSNVSKEKTLFTWLNSHLLSSSELSDSLMLSLPLESLESDESEWRDFFERSLRYFLFVFFTLGLALRSLFLLLSTFICKIINIK